MLILDLSFCYHCMVLQPLMYLNVSSEVQMTLNISVQP